MANKTNLSIGVVIALLIAAYLGLDFKQESTISSVQAPEHSVARTSSNQAESHADAISSQSSEAVSHTIKITQPSSAQQTDGVTEIEQAYQQKRSGVQVQASGVVKAILADDNEGSRHQKFILLLNNGLTLLVAHNIDLAPRIHHLQKGDTVEFFGEYEYSTQGGVMHWTHHDPQKQHADGWLKHKGETYQ